MEKISLKSNISILELLKIYGFHEKNAIELNGIIIPKSNFKKKLKNKDKIEIVHFIGGG